MWKKLIVAVMTVFSLMAAHAGPVVSITITDFKLDLRGIDMAVGGLTNIEYSSPENPGAWDKKIQVQVNPYINSWVHGVTLVGTERWIVDVEGNGVGFSDIKFWGVAAANYQSIYSDFGIGLIWEEDPGYIAFEGRFNTHFTFIPDPVVPNNVPEPGSLALMGLGLLGVGFTTMKKKKVQIATSV